MSPDLAPGDTFYGAKETMIAAVATTKEDTKY